MKTSLRFFFLFAAMLLTLISSPFALGQTITPTPVPTIVPSPVPQKPYDAKVGQKLTAVVTATGSAPLSYQWFEIPLGQTTPQPIQGATSTTFVIASIQPDDAGVYYVVVSNSAGSARSPNVTLNVIVPPQVSSLTTKLEDPTAGR